MRLAAAQQVRVAGEGRVHPGRSRGAHTTADGYLPGRPRPAALALARQQAGQQARPGLVVSQFGKFAF